MTQVLKNELVFGKKGHVRYRTMENNLNGISPSSLPINLSSSHKNA